LTGEKSSRINFLTNLGVSEAFNIAWSKATSLTTNYVGLTNLVNFKNLTLQARNLDIWNKTDISDQVRSYITLCKIRDFYFVLFSYVQWEFTLIKKTL